MPDQKSRMRAHGLWGVGAIAFGLSSVGFAVFLVLGPGVDVNLGDAGATLAAVRESPEGFRRQPLFQTLMLFGMIVLLPGLYFRVRPAANEAATLALIIGVVAVAVGTVALATNPAEYPVKVDRLSLAGEYAKGGEAAVFASGAYLALRMATQGLEGLFLMLQAAWLLVSGSLILETRILPKPVGLLALVGGLVLMAALLATQQNDGLRPLFLVAYALIGSFAIWTGILLWREQRQEGEAGAAKGSQ